MPAWVSSVVRPVPRDRTVFVRFGASLIFAGWFEWLGWQMLSPGGGRTAIEEPPLWFDADEPDISPAEEHFLVFGQETTSAKPLRVPRQRELSFDVSDSGKLSSARHEALNPTGRLI